MTTTSRFLILGGAGAQNSSVARELALSGHKISILSRTATSDQAIALSALPNIDVLEGDTYDEATLLRVLQGMDGIYVNTNGFAIGEKSEIYWGIRIYELAYAAGVKHLIYGALPYVSKKRNFDPKYRVPFVDGKAKVAGDVLPCTVPLRR
jgi:uncharacterized protein YbjT (DUF2867 family)